MEPQFTACFEPLLKGEQIPKVSLHGESRYFPGNSPQVVDDCPLVGEDQAALPLLDAATVFGDVDSKVIGR